MQEKNKNTNGMQLLKTFRGQLLETPYVHEGIHEGFNKVSAVMETVLSSSVDYQYTEYFNGLLAWVSGENMEVFSKEWLEQAEIYQEQLSTLPTDFSSELFGRNSYFLKTISRISKQRKRLLLKVVEAYVNFKIQLFQTTQYLLNDFFQELSVFKGNALSGQFLVSRLQFTLYGFRFLQTEGFALFQTILDSQLEEELVEVQSKQVLKKMNIFTKQLSLFQPEDKSFMKRTLNKANKIDK